MDDVRNLMDLLPKFGDIEDLLEKEIEVDVSAFILRNAIERLEEIQTRKENNSEAATEETLLLIESLIDNLWERIHTGHFSEIPLNTRKIFAIASYLRIFYLLLDDLSLEKIEKCSAILDDAMLIGCTQELYAKHDDLKHSIMQFFDEILSQCSSINNLPILEQKLRQEKKNDIPTLDCPSVMDFSKNFFKLEKPVLLLNTIKHWPALGKWHNLNYIDKVAGNRCVPIEIGNNYTTEEWSQQIVKLRHFLRRQFLESSKKSYDIEYLAQHELFDQIPTLKEDIRIPDYCSLGSKTTAIDIKAWLGPKGTISPMHYDPKHNLLCQVFGTKYIILAAPTDTELLYPHETEFLNNTSQLDAADINFERFPLAKKVKFYQLTLQDGDCLFIPRKWWHYVRAESPSFSVSFWWE